MTLPKPPDTIQPTRRALFAAIALAELPMPRTVTFPGNNREREVNLIFDSIADVRPWTDMLSDSHNWRDSDGREDNLSARGTFAGQPVWVVGSDPAPAPVPPLDEQTRAQLAAITEPAKPAAPAICTHELHGADGGNCPGCGMDGYAANGLTWCDALMLEPGVHHHKCDLYMYRCGDHREDGGHICACGYKWPYEQAPAGAAGPVELAPGEVIPSMPGYVVGQCGHRVARSEWRAGFRTCERCPREQAGTAATR